MSEGNPSDVYIYEERVRAEMGRELGLFFLGGGPFSVPALENRFFDAGTLKCPPRLTMAGILWCPPRKIDFPRRAKVPVSKNKKMPASVNQSIYRDGLKMESATEASGRRRG